MKTRPSFIFLLLGLVIPSCVSTTDSANNSGLRSGHAYVNAKNMAEIIANYMNRKVFQEENPYWKCRHLIRLAGNSKDEIDFAQTTPSRSLPNHSEEYRLTQFLKLFTYDLEIIGNGSPYDWSKSEIIGKQNATYVDYKIRFTMRFRNDLPIQVSKACIYGIKVNVKGASSYEHFLMKGGESITREMNAKVNIASSYQAFGVLGGGVTSSLNNEGKVDLSLWVDDLYVWDDDEKIPPPFN